MILTLFDRIKSRIFRKSQIKDDEIEAVKKLHRKEVDRDIVMIKKLNKVLSNGITIKVYQATGHDND